MFNTKIKPAGDLSGVNAVVNAVAAQLLPQNRSKRHLPRTLFMGGNRLTPAATAELCTMATNANWDFVYVEMDASDPLQSAARGELTISYVVTDGVAQSSCMPFGRIWKRGPGSRARILFEGGRGNCKVWIKSNGRFASCADSAPPSQQELDLANKSIASLAARMPAGGAISVSPLCDAIAIYDFETMVRMNTGL